MKILARIVKSKSRIVKSNPGKLQINNISLPNLYAKLNPKKEEFSFTFIKVSNTKL